MSTPQTTRGRYAVVATGRGQLFTDDPEFARGLVTANRHAGVQAHIVDTKS